MFEMLQQGGDCLTFLYTPDDDSAVNAIVAAMRSNNIPAVPQSKTMGFATMSEVTMSLAVKFLFMYEHKCSRSLYLPMTMSIPMLNTLLDSLLQFRQLCLS